MSEQYDKELQKANIEEAEALVGVIAETERDRVRAEMAYDNAIKPYKRQLQLRSDELQAKREAAMQKLAEVFEQILPTLKGKILVLRSGTVSERETKSLEVDEELLMRLARRFGVVREISDPRPRKLMKMRLNRLLEQRPEMVEKFAKALKRKKTRRMTVKLPREQAEIARDLHPLRTTLSEE